MRKAYRADGRGVSMSGSSANQNKAKNRKPHQIEPPFHWISRLLCPMISRAVVQRAGTDVSFCCMKNGRARQFMRIMTASPRIFVDSSELDTGTVQSSSSCLLVPRGVAKDRCLLGRLGPGSNRVVSPANAETRRVQQGCSDYGTTTRQCDVERRNSAIRSL